MKTFSIGELTQHTEPEAAAEDLIYEAKNLMRRTTNRDVKNGLKKVVDWFESPSALGDVEDVLEKLVEDLQEFCPDLTSIVMIEGRYGVQVDNDLVQSMIVDKEILVVEAGNEWGDVSDFQYVLEVNDHGNRSLFTAHRRVNIWSVV